MKSHYSEEIDEAAGPNETGADICVREHLTLPTSIGSEIAAAGIVIAALLAIATVVEPRGGKVHPAAEAGRVPTSQWQGPDDRASAPRMRDADEDADDVSVRDRHLRD
jgi:hypothetical protein